MAGYADIHIDRGWTSNDFAVLFDSLADVNAIIESLHDPDLLSVSSGTDGTLKIRRRQIPDARQVRVKSIAFNSPGDIRVEVPLGETLDVIREWSKDANWREQLEHQQAAEQLKQVEMDSATQRMRLIDEIISTADRLGVPAEVLADYVMPKLAQAVRGIDRLRERGLVEGLTVLDGADC